VFPHSTEPSLTLVSEHKFTYDHVFHGEGNTEAALYTAGGVFSIQNKHWLTLNRRTVSSLRVYMSIHYEGKSCSDAGRVGVVKDPGGRRAWSRW